MSFSRFAVYYVPSGDSLARFGAAWLGWDAVAALPVAQPDLPGIAQLTETPRKYGFHATLKPPFRLAQGQSRDALEEAVARLASRTATARAEGLRLSRLGRFFALTPAGDDRDIARLAAACVRELDVFRAAMTEQELEKRRKNGLSARQEQLLLDWGYPYVLDAFGFHMTLTGKVPRADLDRTEQMIAKALPPLPKPFVIEAVSLVGEREDGRFEVLQHHPLSA